MRENVWHVTALIIILGVITLAEDLDIDSVTEFFIRINSKGVVLSQADFAMSKISSNETYGSNITRKTIDYFCHLLESPEDLKDIKNNDTAFAALSEFGAIKWAATKSNPIYKTTYNDILREHLPLNLSVAVWQTLLACCQDVILKQENSR